MDRFVSACIAVVYLFAAWSVAGGEAAARIGLFLVFPLACIWFSGSLGDFTGFSGRSVITTASPGWMVALGGWVLLMLPGVIGMIWLLS